ncbi:hypothetical protein Y032_0020g191 [Ancylostoma ceylanicum]|uniref:Uncharacterized protein n=1 Tax=Ancylostoma ceylanicum TaxID=53326 RepID=A0A016V2W7_9BILA|nr:hypothetical protein Y032_0020g191 [Ancylostoma ceylanicum]
MENEIHLLNLHEIFYTQFIHIPYNSRQNDCNFWFCVDNFAKLERGSANFYEGCGYSFGVAQNLLLLCDETNRARHGRRILDFHDLERKVKAVQKGSIFMHSQTEGRLCGHALPSILDMD